LEGIPGMGSNQGNVALVRDRAVFQKESDGISS
jgi:hypothetical protein